MYPLVERIRERRAGGVYAREATLLVSEGVRLVAQVRAVLWREPGNYGMDFPASRHPGYRPKNGREPGAPILPTHTECAVIRYPTRRITSFLFALGGNSARCPSFHMPYGRELYRLNCFHTCRGFFRTPLAVSRQFASSIVYAYRQKNPSS